MRTGKNTKHSKRHLRRWVKVVINFLVCVMIYLASFYTGTGIITLIDYHNNVVRDTLIIARHLGHKLKGVRVDTSKALIDHYFDDKDTSGFDPHGVCKELIFALRSFPTKKRMR